ncbi:MAG: TetR/AcrR family transcriptional regulator [Spirochaetales bacterium]
MSEPSVLDDQKTRDKILRASFALFLQKGYDNTPVQAIIDAVGIAKGTFYHHFASKDAMLVSLVNGMTEQVLAGVMPLVADPNLGVIEKILSISKSAGAIKAGQMGPELVVIVRQMRTQANRPLQDCLNTILHDRIRPVYTPVVLQGIAEGVFHVKHPEWAVSLMLTTIMSFQDAISDCFVTALEAQVRAESEAAMDRLMSIYETLEEAVERVLGAAPGSLPIYTSVNVRGLLAPLFPGGNA